MVYAIIGSCRYVSVISSIQMFHQDIDDDTARQYARRLRINKCPSSLRHFFVLGNTVGQSGQRSNSFYLEIADDVKEFLTGQYGAGAYDELLNVNPQVRTPYNVPLGQRQWHVTSAVHLCKPV